MKKYEVELTETLVYKITVEANTPEEAEEKALASDEFSQNLFKENDCVVTGLEEVE